MLTATPTALTAKALSSRYVQLNWHRSTGDTGSFLYRVFRDGIAIGVQQSANSYLDRPAIGRHLYQVRAIDGVGVRSPLSSSVGVAAVSRLPGASAPATPVTIEGATGAAGQARLTWSAGSSATSGTSAANEFRVYRNGLHIATVGATTTAFDDYRAGLRAKTYNYAVQAVDSAGYASAVTAPVSVRVDPTRFPWAGVPYSAAPSVVPAVALTFDDCYNAKALGRIADILRASDAPGTFFCVGEAVVRNVDLLSIIARDFPIGNHTWNHPNLTSLSDSAVLTQLTDATKKVEAASGRPLASIMRAPYGAVDDRVCGDIKLLGLPVVRWDVDTYDWRSTTTSQMVLDSALKATNGSIVLMHDRAKTANVLAEIITGLRSQGYRLVTVPELLGIPWLPAERDN